MGREKKLRKMSDSELPIELQKSRKNSTCNRKALVEHPFSGLLRDCAKVSNVPLKRKKYSKMQSKACVMKKPSSRQQDRRTRKQDCRGYQKAQDRSGHIQDRSSRKDIDVRVHVCDRCEHRFTTSGNLKRHLAMVHNIGGQSHSCDMCKYKCKQTGHMKRHRANARSTRAKMLSSQSRMCDKCDDIESI